MSTNLTNVTTILSHKGYSVKKCDLSHQDLQQLKSELTVTPEAHPDYPPPQRFPVYEDGSNWIRIPRFYGVNKFGAPKINRLQDNDLDELRCGFAGKLRDNQLTPHDTVLTYLRTAPPEKKCGLLCVPTGAGKTFILLSILSHLKQRACILLHKSQLLQQWKTEITNFLPKMRVGIVQQTKKNFSTDCDIYLVMIQTLLNIPEVPNIFGVTVIDESHHIPSATFSKVLFSVNARYVIGLTATPNRKDGLTQVLHWHVGDIVYQEKPDRREQMTTFVELYRHDPNVTFLDMKQWTVCINNLCKDDTRNKLILKAIQEQLGKDVQVLRRVLILTDRVFHARFIHGNLKKIYHGKRSVGLLIGGMKKHVIEAEMENMILVATFNLMSEGISIPKLNTIVFASPKKDVVQALGRIFRKVHQDVNPMIIDIADTLFKGQEKARMAIYKKELNGNIKLTIHEEDEEEDANSATSGVTAIPQVYRDMMKRNITRKPKFRDDTDEVVEPKQRSCLLDDFD